MFLVNLFIDLVIVIVFWVCCLEFLVILFIVLVICLLLDFVLFVVVVSICEEERIWFDMFLEYLIIFFRFFIIFCSVLFRLFSLFFELRVFILFDKLFLVI